MSGEVCLADFSLASRAVSETPTSSPLALMPSTLAYLPPEQTGRMNRAVDYRTGFYSLGIIFYELLTGSPPFRADDVLELIFARPSAAGRFRPDLFYRLNVFPIRVPPLCERRSDIPQLVMFFFSRFAKKLGKHIEAVPQGVMDLLTMYGWSGNIRELQNLIERAVVLSQGPVLRLDRALLPAATLDAGATPPEGVGSVPLKPDTDGELRRPSVGPAPGDALTLERSKSVIFWGC